MAEYIKELTVPNSDGSGDVTYQIKEDPAIHYSTCGTDAATAAKTVAVSGFKLNTGSWIAVKFTVTNTAAVASLTLNVNSTGAKNIKYRNANLSSAGVLAANRIYLFVYDGTYWQIVGDLDTDTNTTYSAGTGLTLSGTTFNHTDSITASTSTVFKKFKYNATGHITEVADVSASDLPAHEHPYLPLAGGTLTGRVTTTKALNYVITGTGTAGADKGSGQNPRYVPAKWTFNTEQTPTDGDIIIIQIPVAGHDYGVYISINNGVSYHPAVTSGTSRLTTHYANGNYAVFIFKASGSAASMIPLAGNTDGTRVTVTGGVWQGIDYYDSGNTYDRTSMQTRIYAGGVGVFRYSICGLNSAQRMESFTMTGDANGSPTTTKAFNTSAKFAYPPVLMYNAANAVYTNGSVIGNNVLYEQFPSLDMRYSCNKTASGSTAFTAYKPVFIECTFDENGFWSITANGFVQTFTSGKYYILLGCMYNTSVYQLALFAQHPVYYYDGTNLTNLHWDKGNTTTATIGSASAGTPIPADDITAWNAGSAPTLEYTSVSIPNVTGNTEVTIPNVTGNTEVTIPNITGSTDVSVPNITSNNSVTIPNVSSTESVSIPNVTGNSNVTIPNVTGNSDVSVPNITSNSSVTAKSVKDISTCVLTATISSGVLTFTTGPAVTTEDKTSTNTVLGTAKTASKVTLGTALSASKVTLGTALSATKVTMGDDLTATNTVLGTPNTASKVTLGTALKASKVTLGTNLKASKVTLGTAISADDITSWSAGSIPSLSYTAKSIPNITVTNVTDVIKKKT